MTDPNLPEGVTQREIDSAVGETVDPDLCEHWNVKCEECGHTLEKEHDNFLHVHRENMKILEWSEKLHDALVVARKDIDWIYQTVHCAHQEEPFADCRINTCDWAKKSLASIDAILEGKSK